MAQDASMSLNCGPSERRTVYFLLRPGGAVQLVKEKISPYLQHNASGWEGVRCAVCLRSAIMVRKRRYELSLEDGSPTEAEVPSVFPELDTRTKKHLKEVVLSLVFAFAVMLVAYLQRDWMSFYQREAVEQLIKTSSSFWTWSETHLMEALYDGGNAYDNSLQRNSLYKVQWTKFRQERVSQDAPFTIPNDVLSSTFGHCKEPFSSYNKDWR
ncbi:Hypp9518, partial [Branchiostoma lanceolatum]